MCRGPIVCSKPMSVCVSLKNNNTTTTNTNETKSSSSSSSSHNKKNNQRSKGWWTRSVAQRTVSFVEAEVESLTSSCRFLKQAPICQEIQSLRKEDLELGPLLGKGGFSEVYPLVNIHRRHNHDDVSDTEESSLSSFDESSSSMADIGTSSTTGLVVKHLRQDLMSQRTKFHQAAADLVLEAEFLARLDHPNILKIKGWADNGVASFGDGTHDGYFIVLEQLEETLSQRIHSWNKKQQQATKETDKDDNDDDDNDDDSSSYVTKLQYAVQIASALKYLHDRDIIFRDLKPDNIGILNGTIQLFDLGLCRELPEAGCATNNTAKVFHMSGVGTRRYMAPEVAMGSGYNLSADVYSLSMVLYELFTQEKPFELYNPDMHQLLVCQDGQRPVLPDTMPMQLQALLQQAWAANPSDRPSMATFLEQLETMAAAQVQQQVLATTPTHNNSNSNNHLGMTLQRFFGSLFHKNIFLHNNNNNNSASRRNGRSNCDNVGNDQDNTCTTVGIGMSLTSSWNS